MTKRVVLELVKIKIFGSVTSMLNFMRGREAKGKGFNIGTAFIIGIIVIALSGPEILLMTAWIGI